MTIDAYEGVQTPEGIGIGSPVTDVDRIYPGWRENSAVFYRGYASVAGNDRAVYRIAYGQDGIVTELTLQHVDQGCYE